MDLQDQETFSNLPSSSVKSHYDARLVQTAQSRQQSSINGASRRQYVNYGQQQQQQQQFSNHDSPSSSQNHASMYAGEDDIIDLGLTNTSNEDSRHFGWETPKQENSNLRAQPQMPAIPERPTGLRHFSTKVCEKVKQKGLTNYNEVADELVGEYFENNVIHQVDVVKQEYDMKNIRRRVYDALNVLLAMNIITKNKKDIRWIGLPASSAQEISRLEEEKKRREESIKTKLEALQENIVQLVTYKNLIARNKQQEIVHGRPDQHSLLYLPFLIINTSNDSMVDCSVSGDKSEYLFSFDKSFEIHDDLEILKKMGLACGLDDGSATQEQVNQAKSYLPPLIRPYIDDILRGHKRLLEERAAEAKRQEAIRLEEVDTRQQFYNNSNTGSSSNTATATATPAPAGNNRQYQENLGNHSGSVVRQMAMPVKQETTSVRQVVTQRIQQQQQQMQQMQQQLQQNQQQVPQRYVRQMVPPQSTTTTMNGAASVPRPRYFVQKAQPINRIGGQQQGGQQMRQTTRPYVNNTSLPIDRRVVLGSTPAGQPMKYFVAAAHNGPQSQQYKYVSVPQKVQVRPPPPSAAGGGGGQTRVVYTQQNNRVVQQRVVQSAGQQPGTIVRKVIKRVVVQQPKMAGMQQQQHMNHQQQQVQQQQHHIVRKLEDDKNDVKQMDMPMSSRQSDMLQQQQQDDTSQFDNFYDSMDLTDNQMLNFQ